MSWRLLQRIGVVLTLVLAVLLLGSESAEYPALSAAGLRALARGVLPLLVVAVCNLAALEGRRAVRVLALVLNFVFLGSVLTLARPGAPPFVWMSLVVATLLLIASGMRVR